MKRMYPLLFCREQLLFLLLFLVVRGLSNLYWIRQIDAKEYLRLRNLDLGPCLHEGDSFCTRRVANSMCSAEKNECFCKPGYVSIQESYGITCKTLLTNLKCQVDADCVHILNSACHPGAGLCACPSGTIYVPQDHACEQMVEYESNLFCNKCRQVNGVCYRRDQSTRESNRNLKQSMNKLALSDIWHQTHHSIRELLLRYPFGCRCPYNSAMPLATPKNHWIKIHKENVTNSSILFEENDNLADLPQWSFCKAIFVNIGEFCNNIDVLCRAQYSRCTQNEARSNGGQRNALVFKCSCESGYVPVYQSHLGYHECFKQISTNRSECAACIKTGGKCFTMNAQSSTSNGCLCPHDRSPGIPANSIGSPNTHRESSFSGSDSGLESCTESLAEVSCFRNHLEVCYRPPVHPPYNRLSEDLVNQKAVAFVSDTRVNYAYDDACVLTPVVKRPFIFPEENTPNLNGSSKVAGVWCLTLDWRKVPRNPPCGVRLTEYMSGHLYSGYLAILTDAEYQSPVRNLLFHFTCKTNNEIPQQVPGQVFERAWSDEQQELGTSLSKVDISLDLVNQTGQPLETAFEFTPIRLRAQLHDRAAKYHALHMEACYASQSPVDDQDVMESQEYPLIIKGCPARTMTNHPGSYSNNLKTSTSALADLLESPTHFETELFPVSHNAASQVFCRPVDDCPKGAFDSRALENKSIWLRQQYQTDTPAKRPVDKKHVLVRPVEYSVHRLQFRCVIRLCVERAWCCWPVACGSRKGNTMTPRTSFQPPNLRFVTRTVHLNVLQWMATTHEPARTKLKEEQCTNFFCTTGLHTLLLIGLVGLLTCVMGIVGLMLARRYQHRYDNTNYNHRNHIPPKTAAQSHRPPIQPTADANLLPAPAMNKSFRSAYTDDLPGNSTLGPGDAKWWLTLHAYSNSQLNDSLPSTESRPENLPYLTIPRCSCTETGNHVASVNIVPGSHLPATFNSSSPINLTSFQGDSVNRKPDAPLLFTPTTDSTTTSLKGVTYLHLTDTDGIPLSTTWSTPNEINWKAWPGNGLPSDECSSAQSKEYPCVMTRGTLPRGESSSAYSVYDMHDTCART